MAQKLPNKIQKRIKELVYQKANEYCYNKRNRIDNSNFIDNLVSDPEIGGILNEYLLKQNIRTYIKDGVLNRYAKDIKNEQLDCDPCLLVTELTGRKVSLIAQISKKNLSILRLDNGDFYLLSEGTVLKWETALRKALEYSSKTPGLPPEGSKLIIALHLASSGKSLTNSDKVQLQRTLDRIGVNVIFANDD